MNDFQKYFSGKKITVLGLGLLGRGVGDTAFLAECGAELIVTDLKSEEELAPSLRQLKDFKNITYRLGEHREEDFLGRDMVLKAAGIPLDSAYVDIARKDGAEIAMSGALFAKLSGVPVIGVTGTRGKSTVTHLIHHTLKEATEGGKVLLGGNVRGVSNLQLLREVEEDSIAVMELDSWQLQGFGEARISPQIAVFGTFMEDHMNYYLRKSERSGGARTDISERGTQESSALGEAMEKYFADKAQIFLHQEESGVLVTTPEVFERAKEFARGKDITLGQEVVLVDASLLPETWTLKIPGEHNRLNAALALGALRAVGLEDELIRLGFESFSGVEGRLQHLALINGVSIYNDNNATTPAATVAGLKAVANGKNVVLIMGGSDKGIDTTELVAAIRMHVKGVELLAGTGTERIVEEIRGDFPDAAVHTSIPSALEAALQEAKKDDVILFSPAFASFGLFQNEYDRGDRFVAAVSALEA